MSDANLLALTDTQYEAGLASWSPDGMQVAYSLRRDGRYVLERMRADGSDKVLLAAESDADLRSPTWLGEQIAYVVDIWRDSQSLWR